MGATVLTNKRVGAFKSAQGKTVYVLFVRSFEKNVYPHHSTWSAYAMGEYESALRAIYALASDCEGGMLQNRSGHMRPEELIRSFVAKLKNPQRIDDIEIRLDVCESYSGALPKSQLEHVCQTLAESGHPALAQALCATGSATLHLHTDHETLSAIYGPGRNLGLWRILNEAHLSERRDKALAPSLEPSRSTVPDVTAYRLGHEYVIVGTDKGALRNEGWDYSAVASWICHQASQIGLKSTDQALESIAAYRDRLRNAPPLPDSATLTIVRNVPRPSYSESWIQQLAHGLGLIGPDQPPPETIETTMGTVRASRLEDTLPFIGSDHVSWTVPC